MCTTILLISCFKWSMLFVNTTGSFANLMAPFILIPPLIPSRASLSHGSEWKLIRSGDNMYTCLTPSLIDMASEFISSAVCMQFNSEIIFISSASIPVVFTVSINLSCFTQSKALMKQANTFKFTYLHLGVRTFSENCTSCVHLYILVCIILSEILRIWNTRYSLQ